MLGSTNSIRCRTEVVPDCMMMLTSAKYPPARKSTRVRNGLRSIGGGVSFVVLVFRGGWRMRLAARAAEGEDGEVELHVVVDHVREDDAADVAPLLPAAASRR